MNKEQSFHCCATCEHFFVEKDGKNISYKCKRLKYETKPTYQFTCWQPKEHIIQLMKKRNIIMGDHNDST